MLKISQRDSVTLYILAFFVEAIATLNLQLLCGDGSGAESYFAAVYQNSLGIENSLLEYQISSKPIYKVIPKMYLMPQKCSFW